MAALCARSSLPRFLRSWSERDESNGPARSARMARSSGGNLSIGGEGLSSSGVRVRDLTVKLAWHLTKRGSQRIHTQGRADAAAETRLITFVVPHDRLVVSVSALIAGHNERSLARATLCCGGWTRWACWIHLLEVREAIWQQLFG